MSEAFINQVTLDCLVNKEMYNNHIKSKKNNQINKEERKFYRKRTFNLFKEIINGTSPEDLLPDITYAYENFVNATIQYFKTIDNTDIIQSEYKDINFTLEDCSSNIIDCSTNVYNADLLLLRSIKMDVNTLDKYVTRTKTKKKEEIIFPIQKEINLNDPELKNKGIKNNIINIYEDKNTKKKNEEK